MLTAQKRFRVSAGYAQIFVLIAAVVIIVAVAFVLLNRNHKAGAPGGQTADLSGYCVGQTFDTGSSGTCVSDIQTMVNYMEHSGLTQCPFEGGTKLLVSSVYDASTAAQVKSVQGWAGCYARQEGFTTDVQQTGVVDVTTWGELCTYGYTNPKRNGATGASTSITAGEDAGCAQLRQS